MTLSGVMHSKRLSHTVVCIVGSGCVWRVSHAMCMDREERLLYPSLRVFFGHYIFMQGPNYIWHCDGNDKLKKYGFCIHGCIDG